MARSLVTIEAEPWERQPGEPAKAWASFVIYRDLGLRRALRKVAEQTRQGKPRTSQSPAAKHQLQGNIKDWSVKYHWVERCAAWDAELDKRNRDAQLRAIDEHNERVAEISNAMQQLVQARLRGTKDGKVTRLDANDMSAYEVTMMAQVAVKLERLALGISGESGVRGAFVVTGEDVRRLISDIIDLAIELLPRPVLRPFISGLYQLVGGDPSDVFGDEDVFEVEAEEEES